MDKGVVGKWRIVRKIGSGRFAVVYLAEEVLDPSNRVVLKIFREDDVVRRSFENEVKIIAGLRHKNIVEIKDYGFNPMFIAYELMDETLEEHVLNNEISFEEGLEIFLQILYGVEYAYERGVVHQDLNPRNILMKNGVVKISDFGISAIIRRKIEYRGTLLKVGGAGTEYWMSPEQMAGIVDARNDIYSLGKILHYLMTNGGILPSTIRSLKRYNYPEWCKEIVYQCLQPIDKRPQTVKQLIKIIEEHLMPENAEKWLQLGNKYYDEKEYVRKMLEELLDSLS